MKWLIWGGPWLRVILKKLVVLDPYYSFLALLALEELSSSIFSPDVACNGKFEIKTKLQTLLYSNADFPKHRGLCTEKGYSREVCLLLSSPKNL